MRRASKQTPRTPRAAARPIDGALGIAVLVAVLLSAPGLRLGYFWDDYYFLTGAQAAPLSYVMPAAGATFYRPIPQGLYFALLARLGTWGSFAGHAINLAVLALSVALLGRLATRLAGRKAGLLAALAFGAMGAVPTLVAWTSCAQDLFAIAFLLGALLLRDRGRNVGSAALALGALLSKETALVLLPALVLWDWLLGRKPARIGFHALLYGVPALLWAAVHPGIRTLQAYGFQAGVTGYVGLEHPERWARYMAHYLFTLLNLPVTGLSTPWPANRTLVGIAALAALLAWLYPRRRTLEAEPPADRPAIRRIALVSVLLIVPPIVIASVMVRRWNPYFACIPAVGSSLLLGVLASTLPVRRAVAGLACFLVLGIWCRGISIPGADAFAERDCEEASLAIRAVEAGFRSLEPTLPKGSHLLVAVGQSGKAGIMGTLLDNQAHRVWYGDPTLTAMLPERRRGGASAEFLFRVTSERDVLEIHPDDCAYRSSGAPPADPDLVGRTIRSYARGVAASGDPDRAVRILLRLAELDGGPMGDYDRRLAAMIRYSEGRTAEAESLMAGTARFPREISMGMIWKLLAEPTQDAGLDSMAFRVFDVDPSDTSVVRHFLRRYRDEGARAQTKEFAARMLRLAPGDPEAVAFLQEEERRAAAIRTSGPNAIRSP